MTPTEPKTGTHTAEQFTCHDCGFIWLKGQHGGHDCKARILVRLERVKSARDHAESELSDLREKLGVAKTALIVERDFSDDNYTRRRCATALATIRAKSEREGS